jgi:serine/threonine protein kinase
MKKRLGKYSLGERLGGGSMGAVYAAYDESLQRNVAIKTMGEKIGHDPELKLRFYREAKAAAGLHHPNIVAIYDMGEEAGTAYIVMELLEGRDLKCVIDDRSQLPLEQKLSIVAQIGDGMAHAHKRGILHRDIKPSNIYISSVGLAKILDFGIAYIPASNLTESGVRLGTPMYMSPEQIRGQKCDARSDIFSTGVLMYELVTFTHPFRDKTLQRTLDRTLSPEKPPFEQHFPDAPPGLWNVMAPALAKEPERRYQTMADLSTACRTQLREMHAGSQQIARELRFAIPLLERSAAQSPAAPQLNELLAETRRIVERMQRDESDVMQYRRVLEEVRRSITPPSAPRVTTVESRRPTAPRPDAAEKAPAMLNHPSAAGPEPGAGADRLVDLGQRALRQNDLAEAGRLAQRALEQGCDTMAARNLVAEIDMFRRKMIDERVARSRNTGEPDAPEMNNEATVLLPNAQRQSVDPPPPPSSLSSPALSAPAAAMEKTELIRQPPAEQTRGYVLALLAVAVVLSATALFFWSRPSAETGHGGKPAALSASSEMKTSAPEARNTGGKIEVLLVEAQHLRNQGQYAESEEKVREILQLEPGNAAALAIRARLAEFRTASRLVSATASVRNIPAEIPRTASSPAAGAALLQLEYRGARYPVKIHEGGREIGPLPAALPAGEHEIRVVAESVFLDRKQKIAVSAGKDQYMVLPALGSAVFEVSSGSYEGCEILLDGRKLEGPYPAKVEQVVAGDHTVTFQWTSGALAGKKLVFPVSVGENAESQIQVDPAKNAFVLQQAR